MGTGTKRMHFRETLIIVGCLWTIYLRFKLGLAIQTEFEFIGMGLVEIPFENINVNATIVDLTKNHITEVLGYAFQNFTQLQDLRLQQNRIHTIADTAFVGTNLKTLSIHTNKITSLSCVETLLDSLEYFYLGHNPLPLDFDFGRFFGLKLLGISGLGYTRLPDFSTIVPSLTVLIIRQMNKLKCDCKLAWLKKKHNINDLRIDKQPCKNECQLKSTTWTALLPEQMVCMDGYVGNSSVDTQVITDCDTNTCMNLTALSGSLRMELEHGALCSQVDLLVTFKAPVIGINTNLANHSDFTAYMERTTKLDRCGDYYMCQKLPYTSQTGESTWKFTCKCLKGKCTKVYLHVPQTDYGSLCEVGLQFPPSADDLNSDH